MPQWRYQETKTKTKTWFVSKDFFFPEKGKSNSNFLFSRELHEQIK